MPEEDKAGVLLLVLEYWRQHPERRLGQLLVNAAGTQDIFYISDEALRRRLRSLLES